MNDLVSLPGRAVAYLDAHPALLSLVALVLAVSVARLPPVDSVKSPWARWAYAQLRAVLAFASATATHRAGAKGGWKLPFTFEVPAPAEGSPASERDTDPGALGRAVAKALGLGALCLAFAGCAQLAPVRAVIAGAGNVLDLAERTCGALGERGGACGQVDRARDYAKGAQALLGVADAVCSMLPADRCAGDPLTCALAPGGANDCAQARGEAERARRTVDSLLGL